MKRIFLATLTGALLFTACNKSKEVEIAETIELPKPQNIHYGFDFDEFNVVQDTIRNGDTFGHIMNSNGVDHNKVMEVATAYKDSFDVRKIRVGRPYLLLKSKDTSDVAQVFIYQNNITEYSIVDFRESLSVTTFKKPIRIEEKEASGVINSSLSATLDEQSLSPYISDQLSGIYAWTINFFKLQKGDRFKIVYTEKFIDDTISAGLHEIKAAYFEHHGKPLYAFKFDSDNENPEKAISGYFDEEANNLKRAFLQAPVKFSRISSRYNLNRRIKYYGYKVRPHKGTDFAAPIGTPILATADGVVTKSEYRGGNGNYVKIRHNGTYETQYLHMKSRKVKVGEYVKQGDVIGWIGMTGNTSGPHVCYRFWKNGEQVDPFKEEVPFSQPLPEELHETYFASLSTLKERLDQIVF